MLLIQKALAQGHQIRALARSPEKLSNAKNNLEIVKGDMFDTAALAFLVHGVDAVISMAGPPMTGRHDSEHHTSSTKLLVAAMKAAKVDRLIAITGAAAKVPGQPLGFKQSLLRLLLANIVMPDVIKTKDIELRVIAESGLNWTVIRPPRIGTGKATGKVTASEKDMTGMKIDVGDITDFILSLLKTSAWDCKAPIIASQS